jgi:hypothetical protein
MITPEEAKTELSRRAALKSKVTPDQARAELAKRGVPSKDIPFGQKAYNFAQETVPYIAGGVAGAAGAPAGPEIGIPAAGLGYAGAKSGLRGLGRLLGYEKPASLGEESKQTGLRDLPVGMAMEEVAPVAKGLMNTQVAKRAGQGIADLSSVLPGVESRSVKNLFQNPKTLLPSFLGGPPALKESGEAIGAIESKLGIPGIEEREGAQVLRVKPESGMKPGEVKIKDPSRDPKGLMENLQKVMKSVTSRKASFEDAIEALKNEVGAGTKESDRQIAAKVYDEAKAGKMPEVKETVQAIRGLDNRLETMSENPTTEESQNKKLLTDFRKTLVNHLSEMVPDLQKARANYAKGMTRADFVSPGFGLVSKDSGGGLSKMGVGRTFGPFALGRMTNNPAFGALLTGMQSPAVLGAGTAGAGALAKGLQSQISPYAIRSLLETLRRKKEGSGQGQP